MKKTLSAILVLILSLSVLCFGCSKGDKDKVKDNTEVRSASQASDEETGTLPSDSKAEKTTAGDKVTNSGVKATTAAKVNAQTKPRTPTRPAGTTKPPQPKPSATNPPVTTAPPVADPGYDTDYYPPVNGYTIDELEDAMIDYLYSNDWDAFYEYILPGATDVLSIMYEIEDNEGYDNYAYMYGTGGITDYYIAFDEKPVTPQLSWDYHDLDDEDEDYLDNTSWGLYEMTEYAFDEVYGGNMQYRDLMLMETFVYDEEENDYGFFVFVIKTDTGYFFLCE